MAAKKPIVKPGVQPVEKTAEAAVKVEAPKTESVKAEDKATTPEKPVITEDKKTKSAAVKKETVKNSICCVKNLGQAPNFTRSFLTK